jgi:hypothetical protein
MKKTFSQRIAVLGILVLLFLVIYGIARHYSYSIISYVVEQALLQKAPEGTSLIRLRERFEGSMASTPENYKLLKLLALSSYAEKVQKLTPAELDRLLDPGATVPRMGF